ncbi:hypothetical protein DFP72DRAFT_1040381 [Ephemerocybe angulata]|uniref:Uncharacterized protein n=1 Tax=Ephemerocybe angulata TaxID=980116 RepID=A0A8H6MCL8_9AGAR|nr:hypothetical protein DFP72DRAFT_1040381 [Tulosesus angulatus]
MPFAGGVIGACDTARGRIYEVSSVWFTSFFNGATTNQVQNASHSLTSILGFRLPLLKLPPNRRLRALSPSLYKHTRKDVYCKIWPNGRNDECRRILSPGYKKGRDHDETRGPLRKRPWGSGIPRPAIAGATVPTNLEGRQCPLPCMRVTMHSEPSDAETTRKSPQRTSQEYHLFRVLKTYECASIAGHTNEFVATRTSRRMDPADSERKYIGSCWSKDMGTFGGTERVLRVSHSRPRK